MAQALPFIALAATAVGTGVAVYGQMEQAKAAEKAAKFNEKVAENNATAARNAAMAEAERVQRRNRAIIGKARSSFAKSGVLLSGSAEDIIYDSLIQGELDRMTALYTGSQQSSYYHTQGMLARMEGQNASSAAKFSAAGTILSGASSMAGRGYSYYTNNNGYPQFED